MNESEQNPPRPYRQDQDASGHRWLAAQQHHPARIMDAAGGMAPSGGQDSVLHHFTAWRDQNPEAYQEIVESQRREQGPGLEPYVPKPEDGVGIFLTYDIVDGCGELYSTHEEFDREITDNGYRETRIVERRCFSKEEQPGSNLPQLYTTAASIARQTGQVVAITPIVNPMEVVERWREDPFGFQLRVGEPTVIIDGGALQNAGHEVTPEEVAMNLFKQRNASYVDAHNPLPKRHIPAETVYGSWNNPIKYPPETEPGPHSQISPKVIQELE